MWNSYSVKRVYEIKRYGHIQVMEITSLDATEIDQFMECQIVPLKYPCYQILVQLLSVHVVLVLLDMFFH